MSKEWNLHYYQHVRNLAPAAITVITTRERLQKDWNKRSERASLMYGGSRLTAKELDAGQPPVVCTITF